MRQSWVMAVGQVWRERFQAPPNWGMVGKALKEIHAEYGTEEVCRRLRVYLAQADARYVNLWRFASTFGEWQDTSEEVVIGMSYGQDYE